MGCPDKRAGLLYFFCICICYTCTQVITVILKGLPGRFQIFLRRPSSFNPQSRFAGHSAESTEEGCIGKCPQRTSLSLVGGILQHLKASLYYSVAKFYNSIQFNCLHSKSAVRLPVEDYNPVPQSLINILRITLNSLVFQKDPTLQIAA